MNNEMQSTQLINKFVRRIMKEIYHINTYTFIPHRQGLNTLVVNQMTHAVLSGSILFQPFILLHPERLGVRETSSPKNEFSTVQTCHITIWPGFFNRACQE
jgi:hypothetical protein